MSKTAVVLLAEGFEEIEAVTPIDVLRRADVAVTVLSVDGARTVTGAHGLAVVADAALAEYNDTPDLVVLPGGMPGSKNLAESAAARTLCERTLAAGRRVGAICAAPALALGSWGMLSGVHVTGYPGMPFPADAKPVDGTPVVSDGPFITGRGPGAAMHFALALVGALQGNDLEFQLGKSMVMDGYN